MPGLPVLGRRLVGAIWPGPVSRFPRERLSYLSPTISSHVRVLRNGLLTVIPGSVFWRYQPRLKNSEYMSIDGLNLDHSEVLVSDSLDVLSRSGGHHCRSQTP